MTEIEDTSNREHHREKEIESGGWGLLFVWCGLALLADLGWGVALTGIGVIVLGAQVIRRFLNLKMEGFSVVMGALFLAGGIWLLFGIQIGLVPVICIAAGLVLLMSAIRDHLAVARGAALH